MSDDLLVAILAIHGGEPVPFDWAVEYGDDVRFEALWRSSSAQRKLELLTALGPKSRLGKAIHGILHTLDHVQAISGHTPPANSTRRVLITRYRSLGGCVFDVMNGKVTAVSDMFYHLGRFVADADIVFAAAVDVSPRPTLSEVMAASARAGAR